MMASRAALRSSFMGIVYKRERGVGSGRERPGDSQTLVSRGPLLAVLFVFFVDQPDFAFFVEDAIEGLAFAQKDFAELSFLDDADRLQLDHFEHGQEGH